MMRDKNNKKREYKRKNNNQNNIQNKKTNTYNRSNSNNNSKAYTEKETYPHFRYYFKSKHPSLIVDEHSSTEYKYKKVTSSDRDGNRLNDKIDPNPDKTKDTPMYIGKRVRHDNKNNFSRWKYKWKYPNNKKK